MYVLVQDPVPEEHTVGWEKAYRLTQFTLHEEDGTELGYLKLAYWTEASVAEAFPTIWHYKYHHGWRCILTAVEEGDPYKLYDRVQGYRRFGYYGNLSELRKMSEKAIQKLLQEAASECQEELERDKALFMGRPYIDYIKIHEPFRRKGLATLLYQSATHWCAPTLIRSSTLQTKEAQKVWETLVAKGWTAPAKVEDKDCYHLLPQCVPVPDVPMVRA